ncbi:2-hydroxy-6-oxo-6-(2'-aminophenyl)hexa-2,4-dienoic acid hydrolase [Baekduia alba]|uniref:alpha/beta fold hydrolase n=1 Tax=Baekduia alba TaxID=2997333 RepID=UPI00233FAFEF|nr:alpha/beta hydrolase [Baekduia alba]WCB93770.1 2-hydroxy-6-oxo-6-(2'-aminophenyl)hexa-2,4-dienoic acid hydrolase [Baekduia alba]
MASVLNADRDTVAVELYGPVGRSAWLDVDWRAHQRWVNVAGRPINVIDIGPGADAGPAQGTIVFIHGLSGSWPNWLENLPFFAAAGYRCIAMDLPGFGASPMPAETFTISRCAAWVDELLRVLGVTRAIVIGNSMGGFIGLELAIAFSTTVERLVLVSAAGLTVESQRGLFRAVKPLSRALGMGTAWLASQSDELARRPRSRKAMMKIVTAHGDRLPAALVAEQLRGSGKPGFVDAFDALTDYPIRERLPEIAAPTLVVWGEDDPLVPVRDAWMFGELIPDARVVVYEDTGHVAMFERPAAFNALVEAFLRE